MPVFRLLRRTSIPPSNTATTTMMTMMALNKSALLGAHLKSGHHAYQAFLRHAGDQAPVARKYAAARKAARSRGARAVHGVQQPVVHPETAVKPHGMVDAGDHQFVAGHRQRMRLERRIEQLKVRRISQQAAMQGLVVRQLVDSADPHVLERRPLFRTREVRDLGGLELEWPLLVQYFQQGGW